MDRLSIYAEKKRALLGDIALEIVRELREHAPQGAIAYLKRLYYDTAIVGTPYTLRSLQQIVKPTQIICW